MVLIPTLKPWAVKAFGNYRVAGVTGLLTAAGAASDIASFRWGSTTKDCVVWAVNWSWWVQTGFTAGQIVDHAMYKAKAFTASPSGGTSLLPATGGQKKKTSHADSVLTAFQIATTGALTTGTRTLESLPIAYRSYWCPTTTAGVVLPDVGPTLDPDFGVLYLTKDEGLVIQNPTAMGAAGIIVLELTVAWSEIVPDSLFQTDATSSGFAYGQ